MGRGLEAHPQRPLFGNLMSKLFGFAELGVCFLVSMNPNWNIDAYTRLVYHYLFKQPIQTIVLNREEADLHAENARKAAEEQAQQEAEAGIDQEDEEAVNLRNRYSGEAEQNITHEKEVKEEENSQNEIESDRHRLIARAERDGSEGHIGHEKTD